eukprot:COSAG01_NODE_2768_length_7090_cov_5.238938_1_plen_33_part_00
MMMVALLLLTVAAVAGDGSDAMGARWAPEHLR